MERNGHHEFDIFVERHRNQLESSGVPETFWNSLYAKLDAGVGAGNKIVSTNRCHVQI
jgi:hypothetical protein